MREIVLDTETTGLDPLSGHRVVEVGCIELLNHMPTGREFHFYANPERDMPPEAEAVHGLSSSFLADKPLFSSLADELLGFIGDAPIIAHNAGFDMGFINAELRRAGKSPAPRPALMPCAGAFRSICPNAANTARCSTPSFSPRSIWNWWAAANRASPWPATPSTPARLWWKSRPARPARRGRTRQAPTS